ALTGILDRFGYDVKMKGAPVRGYDAFLAFARARNLAPATVLDVGVGPGTPWLYDAFPDAKLVLFEPLREYVAQNSGLIAARGAEIHNVALSDKAGEMRIRIPSVASGASLLERSEELEKLNAGRLANNPDEYRNIRVETLDSFDRYAAPYLLKIDVEGNELMVMKGGKQVLQKTDMVIAEASILPRHVNEPTLLDMMNFMDAQGFSLFDIPQMQQASPDGPLVFIDVAFVRRDSDWYQSAYLTEQP
ncbi:MAG: FkbM family methyltransferase, partial [Alphaproteobacteria bacterium]